MRAKRGFRGVRPGGVWGVPKCSHSPKGFGMLHEMQFIVRLSYGKIQRKRITFFLGELVNDAENSHHRRRRRYYSSAQSLFEGRWIRSSRGERWSRWLSLTCQRKA